MDTHVKIMVSGLSICYCVVIRISSFSLSPLVGRTGQRMEALLSDSRFKRRNLDLKPGDAVLFHCNLVHRSLPNASDGTR